ARGRKSDRTSINLARTGSTFRRNSRALRSASGARLWTGASTLMLVAPYSRLGWIQMEAHLSSHHRNTVEKIFRHPASGNIEWRQVVSLLEEIGTVRHEHNGKLKVTLGPETE